MIKTLLCGILAIISSMTFGARIYSGHHASGTADYNYDSDSGRLYRGHHASGQAAFAISGSISRAILILLAEKDL